MNKALHRFLRYAGVGVTTFLLDLLLLSVFVEQFKWGYGISTGVAFLVAISLNYFISRKYVFKGTEQTMKKGYIQFIAIAVIGATIAILGMNFLVGTLGWNYILARICIACMVGTGNYLVNLYYNFKVTGKH